MNYKKIKVTTLMFMFVIMIVFTFSVIQTNERERTIQTSGAIESLSNKKIEWGIKRNDNHMQPDLGNTNKRVLEEQKGIAIGNAESKKVYLTFDEGYEAGYTQKILEVLKQNDVKATFFITAHYVNTQTELVQKMIDDGHIIGNHTPEYLMSANNKKIKC